jgi:hypothetical protein
MREPLSLSQQYPPGGGTNGPSWTAQVLSYGHRPFLKGHWSLVRAALRGNSGTLGFSAVADLRGLLPVPAGADAVAYERAGYVTAIRAADNSYGALSYQRGAR